MKDWKDHEAMTLSPDEREALRHVGRAPEAAAGADARERARNAFLTGEQPGVERPRRRSGRVLMPLAIAAAVAGLAIWGALPADQWVIESTRDGAGAAAAPAARGESFGQGELAASDEGWLEARLGDHLRVALPPGSRVSLPRAPGRWFGSRPTIELIRGEILVSTGNARLPRGLRVITSSATTDVLGTTFAVRLNELGTCVCLLEGSVDVRCAKGGGVPLVAGDEVQIFSDGRPAESVALHDDARARLTGLHARAADTP